MESCVSHEPRRRLQSIGIIARTHRLPGNIAAEQPAEPCRCAEAGSTDNGSVPMKNSLEPPSLLVSETGDEVVIHHADRLHVRIHDGRTDEAESAPLEILAERVGLA